jgi:hypothetical protein
MKYIKNPIIETSTVEEQLKDTSYALDGLMVQPSWEALKDMKEIYPTQVADFAVAQKIADLPAFWWWVPQALKRRESIINAIKTCFKKKTHKYGIQVPQNMDQLLAPSNTQGDEK